jgi:hypothetical protein
VPDLFTIMAIKLSSRSAKASLVQEILTKHGCIIATRVGFHEISEEKCSTDGFIVLQLNGKEDEIRALFGELQAVEGVTPMMIEF